MKIPLNDLALAYELRQEAKTPWKLIAQALGHDPRAISQAVKYAIKKGVARG
jgi:DNA-binding Lrp family transcriptional regulator